MANSGDSKAHWQALKDAGDIQFAPRLPEPPQPPSPFAEWLGSALRALGKLLQPLFEPIGRALGLSWPVFQWVLGALAVVLVLALAWQIIAPLVRARRAAKAPAAPEWRPDEAAALALLADADALAARGDYAAAVHILLERSVAQIASARPEWIAPASTAREISGMLALPAAARLAFATIAQRVEASRFALRALAAEDWSAARAAYAEFALQRLAA